MAVIIETLMGEDLDLGILPTTKTHPSGGTLPGTQISLSTFALGGAAGQASAALWTPGTVVAGGQVTTTIAVSGAALGDMVLLSLTSLGTVPLLLTGHVSDDNAVTVVLANLTGASQTIAQGTLAALVFRVRVATP